MRMVSKESELVEMSPKLKITYEQFYSQCRGYILGQLGLKFYTKKNSKVNRSLA